MDNQGKTIKLASEQVLCRAGEVGNDLYFVTSGQLMICSREGRMVTPLARLKKGEYFGELSFFDSLPRSADVIALEDTTLIQIPKKEIFNQIPEWIITLGQQMSTKIRLLDDAISSKGIKRQNAQLKPLSIEEQRYYFELINEE